MALANLGSIAAKVLQRVEAVPTSISGVLVDIVDEERLFIEQFTGQNVGSVGIAEKFQPPLINLVSAKTLDLMQLEGSDASEIRLGDFTVKKGTESSLTKASDAFRQDALFKLRQLGKKMNWKRSLS